MTDEELLRIYTEARAKNFSDKTGISDGLRAVFLAGARAQRDAFVDVLLEVSVIRDREEAERLVDEAMQRAAPLVGGEGK